MRIDLLARRWGGPDGGRDGMSIAVSFLAWTLAELGHTVRCHHAEGTAPPWQHRCVTWLARALLITPDDWTADLVITTINLENVVCVADLILYAHKDIAWFAVSNVFGHKLNPNPFVSGSQAFSAWPQEPDIHVAVFHIFPGAGILLSSPPHKKDRVRLLVKFIKTVPLYHLSIEGCGCFSEQLPVFYGRPRGNYGNMAADDSRKLPRIIGVAIFGILNIKSEIRNGIVRDAEFNT